MSLFTLIRARRKCYFSSLVMGRVPENPPRPEGFLLAPHHPFTHEQATPSGDFLEKNHENLS